MAVDQPMQGKPDDEVIVVSDEALQKAEAFVEAEKAQPTADGLGRGGISTAIAVVDEPVSPLCGLRDRSNPGTSLHPRRLHVGAEFPAVSDGDAVSQPRALVGRRAGICRGGDHRLCAVGRRRFTDRATSPDRWDVIVGIVFIVLLLERPPHHRADHARGGVAVHRLCDARPASAGAVDASRLRPAASGRPSLIHRWRAFSASRSMSRRP
jgi:hypothetical protein